MQDKLEEARKTFYKISDPNSKSDANNWILAGQIVEQDDLAVALAQAKNFTENPNYYIGRIIQRKIEAGKVIEAEEIINNVPDSEVKVEGYIDLAEYYLRKDQKVLFEKYLHKAQRENEFVDRVFIAACHYWSIAKMYAEAGNWEAGLECAKKAENISSESFQEEYKSGKFPRPFYNDNYQLYRLMIYAGRLDEAFQVIISEGELLPIDITCMLTCSFAKDGNMEKLHVLIQLAKTEKEKFIICRSIVDGLIARKKEREENDK